MTEGEKDYWLLWNQLYAHIGPVKFNQLLKAFGSARRAWEEPRNAFAELGWDKKALQELDRRESLTVKTISEQLDRLEAKVMTIAEDIYPENLRSIYDPPPLLYVRGKLLPSDNLSLAVVGTRRMTRYGREVVEALVPELSAAGLTIISGLALGVDAFAHKAALSVKGRTIAILAGGVDQITPRSNEQLGREILGRGGAIVSEFPLGTPSFKSHFPFRNRVISGMALGTLVVEAAEGSGTFHTVRAALEQGREVFAVPGSIFSPFSAGTAKLIQTGAKPVTAVKDILEELDVKVRGEVQKAREIMPTTEKEEELLALIGDEEKHVDEIIKASGMSTDEALSTLTHLEMKGLVKMVGSGRYRRIT